MGIFSSGPDPQQAAAMQQQQQSVEAYQTGVQGLQPQTQAFGDVTQQALGALGSFNPLEAQQQLFAQQQQLMQPYQDQQRQSQEARLLAQGRLGSTGGGIQQQALEGAFQQQQQQALFGSFNQAQGAQSNLLSMAQGAFVPQLNALTQQSQVPGMYSNLATGYGNMAASAGGGMFGALAGSMLGGMAGPFGAQLGASIGGSLFGGGGGLTNNDIGNITPGEYSQAQLFGFG